LEKTTPLGSGSKDMSDAQMPASSQQRKQKPARKTRSDSKRKPSTKAAPKADRINVTDGVDAECYVCCGLYSSSKPNEKKMDLM